MSITLRINGNEISAEAETTILAAAQQNDIYIPTLCYHPSLGSSHGLLPVEAVYREDGEYRNDASGPEDGFSGCRLCLVGIKGREGLFTSCDTVVEEGMEVTSETEAVKETRKDNLTEMLKEHPHACLLCAQQEGCSRTQCSASVPENERCCPLLGRCELQKVSRYIGIRESLSKYVFGNLPKHENEALFNRDYNLCIACLRCVRACRDLRGVETLGFVYRGGRAIVGPTKSPIYADSACTFCGACVEVCPTGAITDKDRPKGERQNVLVPCIANCPAEIDIPAYIRLIGEGRNFEALAVIRERVLFPATVGHVCFHPCEDVCRRSELNEPMAICNLKRFAAENGHALSKPSTRDPTGKKVAVVGSGPAGLSAAYYLARSGHGVTVFEAQEKLGGMLRYAIPDYRLPPQVLEEEFRVLDEMGMEFKTNTAIGKDITLSNLHNDFDAVFIGVGASLSKKIPVEGSDLEGVIWGLEFLKDVKEKNVTSMSKRVVVIGGGNVAMDVARSAIRLGASEVQLACLESAQEMPAHDWEIEEAKDEGVVMNPSWGPNRILGENKVTGIELVRCTSVFDKEGNFAPEFDDSTMITMDTDSVILAIGQTSDTSFMEGIDLQRGTISLDEEMQTSTPGIFAGGEVARGPASVVEVLADGAKAASAIDRYLGGDGEIYDAMETEAPNPRIGQSEGFAGMVRVESPKRPVNERKGTFDAVELGYDENHAKQEAARCLRCDLRLLISPVVLPPEKWLELNKDNLEDVPDKEGVYQLLDEEKMVISIKGTMNLRKDLDAVQGAPGKARYFSYEEDPMFTKRESELIQQFLSQHGRMPEGGEDDLDDLF